MAEDPDSPRKRPRLDDGLNTISAELTDPNLSQRPEESSKARREPTQEEQEQAVGIAVYVSPEIPGFQCTVKQRYTDFLVNEILPDGTTVHLTDIGQEEVQKNKSNQIKTSGHKNGVNSVISSRAAEKQDTNGSNDPLKRSASASTQSSAPQHGEKADNVDQSFTGAAPSVEVGTDNTKSSHKEQKDTILASLSEADRSVLVGIFGEVTTPQILDLYCLIMIHSQRKPRDLPTVKSEVISEKSKRTEAHVAVRRIFASKLETATLPDEPGVIAVRAAPKKGSNDGRGRANRVENGDGSYQKGKLAWDQLGGEYLHFTLYKENKDTMEILYFIASELKVPAKNFQFAGTKDRRGVTVQRVAIHRVRADRIARLNASARGWRAGSFEYKPHGLDLGDLGGNEFYLTLRDCRFDADATLDFPSKVALAQDLVARASESFRNRGFLNYFGLQRFGSFSTGTHEVGKKMLQGDLGGAIDAILSYQEALLPENQSGNDESKVPQDDINRADAIRTWYESGKSSKAVSKMPRRFQAESAIIQYLGRRDPKTDKLVQERDWQGAFMQIQRNLRLMYVHAYQSFVWNTAAGKRWELFGDKVVAGDLVIIGEKDEDKVGTKSDEVDEDGEPIFHPAGEDKAAGADEQFTRARALTDAEVQSGDFDIFDIVLPLPGFDVIYPSNAIGRFYEEFMGSELGGQLDPHNMRRAWKDISMSGDYRKVMSRPGKDFAFQVRSYAEVEEQMVATDLEKLEGRMQGIKESADDAIDGHDKIAVVLKLQLGRSQYATMALRELTKGGASNYKPDYSTAR